MYINPCDLHHMFWTVLGFLPFRLVFVHYLFIKLFFTTRRRKCIYRCINAGIDFKFCNEAGLLVRTENKVHRTMLLFASNKWWSTIT